jgi:magnesium-transporting ATPase (P-type)
MLFHLLPLDEALAALRSGPDGLTPEEAARRRQEFGPNTLARVRRTSLAVRLLKEFVHFFALILWVAAGLCFLAEWRDPGGGMGRLGTAILAMIVVNGLLPSGKRPGPNKPCAGWKPCCPRRCWWRGLAAWCADQPLI